MSAALGCPACGSADLGTIERLYGYAGCRITTDDIEHDGYTDVDWDSTTTVGVTCACGWEHRGEDWRAALVPVPDSAE